MRNQQSVHKRAKDARWRSHRVGARTRRPQRPHFDKPRYTFARSTSGVLFFWCGGCENPQLAGKARMPYKMNAQSFARCETNRAFINVQRMHDSGRTESLHDAATQTTAIRHPATLPLPQTGIALLFLVLGGEFALCG